MLKEPKGTNISPTYANGRSWLRFVGDNTKLCTQIVQGDPQPRTDRQLLLSLQHPGRTLMPVRHHKAIA